MSDTRTQLRVIYHGRVQGVGFRYTTNRIARRFDVAGSVRNLAAGTVELVVAGATDEVQLFLAAIADRFDGNITHADQEALEESVDIPLGFSIGH